MIILASLVLAIIISICWYGPIVRAQGSHKVLQVKDYVRIILVYGLLFTCLLIIIAELTWDHRIGKLLTGLPKSLIESFFRAALIEEFFKFQGFKLAKQKLHLSRKTDYILTAGLIGICYSIVEKVAVGNLVAVAVGLAVPMHIMWQLNQGGHYFEYEQAKAAGDRVLARKEWCMAVLLPFFFHGCWDSVLELCGFCIAHPSDYVNVIGVVLESAAVVFGLIYSVKTVKKSCRISRQDLGPQAKRS